ncbi:hypothetical protein [Methylococcus geothermalis]|uniref:Glycosyltransferase RgtA/B/C/D-like domain-containing protein n=1 Tax=Methylococcus geothermalis TaxID=2681310 RepID=A0A858Q8H2_9GAMM|nr:hypothetical protein [Methylococcus geothermalis]QJD30006.1 hypothetical protein GNH96_08505 [Methylococcus geothermalis]
MPSLRFPVPRSEAGARLAAAALMIGFFVISVAVGDTINKDGVLYLDAAAAFLEQGMKAAAAIYGWPGYSLLIAATSRLTGWPLEASAHLLNAACFLAIADSFVRLHFALRSEEDSPSGWTPVLLILAFPALGDRLNIVRDWGFLAASLWGLLHLVKFRFEPQRRFGNAMFWQAGVAAAFVFRIEALVLILAVPVYFLLEPLPWRLRTRHFLFSISGIVPVLILGAALLATGKLAPGKLWEITAYGYHDPALIWKYFSLHADRLAAALPNDYGADHAKLILGSGLVAVLFWLIGANLGPVLLGIFGYAVYRHGWRLPPRFRLMLWTAGMASSTLLVFLVVQLVPDKRYALLPSALLLLAGGVYLERIVAGTESPWARRLSLALVAALCLKSAVVTPDYRLYLRDVGRWMRANIPAGASLATNDPRIDYYAGRPMNQEQTRQLTPVDRLADWLAQPGLPDYLALRLTSPRDLKKAENALNRKPLKTFSPSPREHVLIYRLNGGNSGAP